MDPGRARERLSSWIDQVRRGGRRQWSSGARLHLELRRLDEPARADLQKALEGELAGMDGVRWARIHPLLNRVIVAYDAQRMSPDRITALIESVEERLGLHRNPFAVSEPELHPGNREPLVRTMIELGTDAWALGMATFMKLTGRKPSHREIEVAAVLSLLETVPAIRRPIERVFGEPATELFIDLGKAINRIFAQSQAGTLSQTIDRALRLRELHLRRRLWATWEPKLMAEYEHEPRPPGPGKRIPSSSRGPVDQYADRATPAAVGAFGLGLASSGGTGGAAAALFAGLPRPAHHGREAFACHLGARLAQADVLVMQPRALRRLDRIDTVVADVGIVDGAPHLAQAARRSQLELVVARDDARRHVERRQSRGATVCYIGSGPRDAYRLADVAVGTRHGGAPWGAHIMCESAAMTVSVVRAIGLARRASKQGVALSALDTAIGLTLSSAGLAPEVTRRIMSAASSISILAMANSVRLAQQVVCDAGSADAVKVDWHELEPEEVLTRLDSSRAGLSEEQARERRTPPPRPRPRPLRLVAAVHDELTNPMTPVLLSAAGLSAFTGALTDAGLIGAVLATNALFGGIERYHASVAVERLAHNGGHEARVRRDGSVVEVDRRSLCPGDVVELESGDVVPADGRLLDCRGLEMDESTLTGESLPVSKDVAAVSAAAIADRASMVYEGTVVAAGTGVMVVVATGTNTEAQRALAMSEEGDHDTGVEKRLEQLTQLTLPFAGTAGVILAAAAALRGQGGPAIVGAGVSLAVAAVPEGLPLLATISQLAAARRLSERGALVRNPRAVEALGRVDVLCADKTATLTEGTIRLTRVSDGEDDAALDELSSRQQRVVAVAVRATPAPDPDDALPHLTDQALIEGARAAAIGGARGGDDTERERELPFEPRRGYHAVRARRHGNVILSVKGAPETVLPRCTARRGAEGEIHLDEDGRTALTHEARRLAEAGHRVLAVAERDLDRSAGGDLSDDSVAELIFEGFVCFSDPVRPAARAAVASLERAGIRTIMVTGDHPSTACAIAAELGLTAGEVIAGPELEAMGDEELAERARSASVFARVTPVQKVRIVRALSEDGFTVAMTGDGANDAPAIRLADVGIALGQRATAAAKQAADMIVTDERIETIVTAVLEGRALWTSVRDAIAILVGGNLGEILFTLASGLAPGAGGLNPRQLLLVNIVTDTLPALAIAAGRPRKVSPETLMAEGTERSLGDELDREIAARAVITAGAAGLGYAAARLGGKRGASTVGLLSLTGSQLIQTMLAGGRGKAIIGASVGSMALVAAAVQTPGVSRFFGCRPLGPVGWAQAGAAIGAAGLTSYLRSRRRGKLADVNA